MLQHLLLLLSAVIWGTVHPISKQVLLDGLTSTHVTLSRVLLGTLAMIAVAVFTGRFAQLARISRRELLTVAVVGFCGYFVCVWLSMNSLRYLPASTNSLLANTSPLFVVLGSLLILRAWPTKRAALGLLAGFAGVWVLTLSRESAPGDIVPFGVVIALVGSAAWALYTAVGRWSLDRLDAVLVTLISGFVSLPPLVGLAVAEGRLDDLFGASPLVLVRLLWLGIIATGVSFLIWTAALRKLGAASVAAYGYLIPVFAVVFSYLLLGEQITPLFIVGAALVLLGVAAAQR